MEKNELSPEARHCLWRCYSLLLELAEETDDDMFEETNLGEEDDSVGTTETDKLTQLNTEISQARPELAAGENRV